LTPTPDRDRREDSEEERIKKFTKRYGFSSAEEVKRLMSFFNSAVENYGDVEAGLLPIRGLSYWICDFSGVTDVQSLGHLIDRDWPKEKHLTEDDFFEWYNNHQWSEEIMVPDPLERRVRHFCKKEGYHITDVERVKAAFDKADKDGSGYLDQQEFAACYAALGGIHPSEVIETKFRILWEEVDEDHNGQIDLLEFAKWYLRLKPLGRGRSKPILSDR